MKRLSALQSRPQRTYDSDLESIENPRYPKPDDDEKVKTAPRQSVEPERDIGVNDGGRGGRLLHSDASKVCRRLRCLPQRRRVQPARYAAGVNRFRRQGGGGLYGPDVRSYRTSSLRNRVRSQPRFDTRLSDRRRVWRRPRIGNSYRWTPRTQRSFLWQSQGSFACKETFGRKALSGIGKLPGVPIRLIHCCARRNGGQSLNTKGPLGPQREQ